MTDDQSRSTTVGPTLRLRRFDPLKRMIGLKTNQNPRKYHSSLIFGPSQSGKTHLLLHLLYLHREIYDIGFAMHGTRDGVEDTKHIIPSVLNQTYSLDRFKKNCNQLFSSEQEIKEADLDVVTYLDDCTFDRKLMRQEETRALYMNGRHCNADRWMTSQYCMDIPPDLRSQFQFVFITKQTQLDIRKKIHNYFFGILPEKQFYQVLDQCTQNYEVLVLDRTVTTSSKAEDCLFYYKAPKEIPDYKLFSDQVWAFNDAALKHRVTLRERANGGGAGNGTSGDSATTADTAGTAGTANIMVEPPRPEDPNSREIML